MDKPTENVEVSRHLLDKYRDCGVYDEWWNFTYSDWDNRLFDKGIDVRVKGVRRSTGKGIPAIYFSGFSSQGDGACFEADLDIPKFMKAHKLDEEFPYVAFAYELGLEVHVSVTHSDRYYHSRSVDFDIQVDDPEEGWETSDNLREAAAFSLSTKFDHKAFEDRVKEICRGYMDAIYRDLEQEYTYRTSDEIVAEWVRANCQEELVQEESDY